MNPTLKKALIALAIILPLLAAAGVGLYYFQCQRPYALAKNELPQDAPRLHEDADGTLTLFWEPGENVDDYTVELLRGGEVTWSGTYTGASCILPEDAPGATVRVTSRKKYKTPKREDYRPCEQPLEAALPAALPDLSTLTTTVDPDADTLLLSWQGVEGETVSVYDENGALLRTVRDNFTLISFKTDVSMPRKDQSRSFTLRAGLENTQVEFSTDKSVSASVSGEDLRGTLLIMEIADLGNNYYTLSWNETRGDYYDLWELDPDGSWRSLGRYTDDMPLSLTVGPLKAYTDHTYRVTASGEHSLPGSEYSATPDEVSFTTGPTVIYATVWPLTDLPIYSDPSGMEEIGTAPASRAFCVAAEEDGMFLVYFDGGRGYIDSTYCLINLPDYLGDICSYDIKNSYDAIYMVHGYGIPTVTGTVITGYEEVASSYAPGLAWKSAAVDTGDPEGDTGGEDAEDAEDAGDTEEIENTENTENTDQETGPQLPEIPTVVDGRFVDANGEPLPTEPPAIPRTSADTEELDEETAAALAEIYTEDSPYTLTQAEVETPTEFLVPLLYPTAKKIAQSAEKARDLGYRLKIYDAFRPYNATRMLYDTAESLLENEIPLYEYDLMDGEMWTDWVEELFPPEPEVPEGENSEMPDSPDSHEDAAPPDAPEETEKTEAPQPDEPASPDEPETPHEPRPTYSSVMTNGRYKLNSFLARSGSTHNQGVAVDITLEDPETGEELVMQTSMHDLSWNSILDFNNDEAKLLAEIMTGSELGTLVSEWWHFQDNELRNSVKLPYRPEGVTRAGWIADTTGWRYRLSTGDYLTSGTYSVNGHIYTFDETGYSDYTSWEIPENPLGE